MFQSCFGKGFKVEGVECGVQNIGCGVQSSGFRVESLGSRAWGSWFRFQVSGFRGHGTDSQTITVWPSH